MTIHFAADILEATFPVTLTRNMGFTVMGVNITIK